MFLRHLNWFWVLLYLCCFSHSTLAMEFMEEQKDELDQTDSAEMPSLLTGYTKDTIVHFNPRKSDAGFRQLWEHIPLEKAKDVIKR